jgi:hypothetical protein
MTSNSALERTAGSHALAPAAHRNVRPHRDRLASLIKCGVVSVHFKEI